MCDHTLFINTTEFLALGGLSLILSAILLMILLERVLKPKRCVDCTKTLND